MQDVKTPINLVLTLEEVNGILNLLGQAPYVQAVNVIKKIQEQAVPQVQEAQPEETKPAKIAE